MGANYICFDYYQFECINLIVIKNNVGLILGTCRKSFGLQMKQIETRQKIGALAWLSCNSAPNCVSEGFDPACPSDALMPWAAWAAGTGPGQ